MKPLWIFVMVVVLVIIFAGEPEYWPANLFTGRKAA